MARLNWKSDALATVIRPLPKGTGYPPKRHRGVILWKAGSNSSIRLFCLCHPEQREGSRNW